MDSELDRSSPQLPFAAASVSGLRFAEHHERLIRMVTFRLDPRLRSRVDAADVVQDVYVEAAKHDADLTTMSAQSLFLWLRGVVGNKLLEITRHHLGTKMRDAGREVSTSPRTSDATSQLMVHQLAGHVTGPGTAAARDEAKASLMDALNSMDPIDREVLALRHFEQLTNEEAAQVLDIQERAAAKRYLRALQRLRGALASMPGGLTELR